jgi:hypothetical protein
VLVTIVIAASAFLAAVLSLALLREVRLRRALEKLLARILAAWRNRNGSIPDQAADADRGDDSDQRM